ncbi:urea transporter [Dactylosporangium sp. NPDC000521]|uniref:urea transporter n=1 Tax=Dactylosporangium sp. NPDC000521 TaxID=3363975 RepID=UPI003692CE5D
MRFLDTVLRGAGQVFLQDHPTTGLLFLIAIGWAAVTGRHLDVLAGAVTGLIVGTLAAALLRVPDASIRQGLYGFNALLTGIALATFLPNTPHLWVLLVIGTAVTTVVTLAIGNIAKAWGVPPLTAPFVLTTWLLLLAAYQFHHVDATHLGPASLPAPIPAGAAHAELSTTSFVTAILRGVSQVFLLDNWVSGLIILAGLAASSVWAALYALGGSLIATITALWLGANADSTLKGLYGFSAVLTAVALGTVFYPTVIRTAVYTLFAILFTTAVQAALNTWLQPVGIATLTAPFVLTTWLFLIPREDRKPVIAQTRLTDRLLSRQPSEPQLPPMA